MADPPAPASTSTSTSKPESNITEHGDEFHIPLAYRLWTLYLEPLSAVNGIIFGLVDPVGLASVFVPSTPSLSPSSSVVDIELSIAQHAGRLSALTQAFLTQTFSLYILFAILEAVLLRWATYTPLLKGNPQARMRIWVIVFWAMLASDGFYLLSAWQMYAGPEVGEGAREVFLKPWSWRRNEWLALPASWLALGFRVAFLAGVGLERGKGGEREERWRRGSRAWRIGVY